MKRKLSKILLCAAFLSFLGIGVGQSEERATPLTRAELVKRRAASQERKTKLVSEESPERSMHPSQSSILDRSTVISDGRHWTIVPKGAVMYLPGKYKNRLDSNQQGRYLDFPEFLGMNRGWIETRNVTLQQARGQVAVSDEVRDSFKKVERLVISVFRKGPISMRPHKDSSETASK
jgi:hypothetical protein